MTPYEEKIVQAYKDACTENKEKDGEASASPSDVTRLMAKRHQLTDLDTTIDIADQMKILRARGEL